MSDERGKTKTEGSRAACGDDHDLAVWFTPDAIRQHLDKGNDEDHPIVQRLKAVTDDDLAEAAGDALLSFGEVWRLFDEMSWHILDAAERIAKKRGATA